MAAGHPPPQKTEVVAIKPSRQDYDGGDICVGPWHRAGHSERFVVSAGSGMGGATPPPRLW